MKLLQNALLLVAGLALFATATVSSCGETTYVFDEVDVGDDEAGRTPRERSDSQFIRAVYADLIGRSTGTQEVTVRFGNGTPLVLPIDEQDTLENILQGLGDSRALRAVLVAGLVDHEEANIPDKADVTDAAEFVGEQFRRFLGRNPSAYELAAFVADWNTDDAISPKTVIRALIGSREYQSQ